LLRGEIIVYGENGGNYLMEIILLLEWRRWRQSCWWNGGDGGEIVDREGKIICGDDGGGMMFVIGK
jgi:hypothetical protein